MNTTGCRGNFCTTLGVLLDMNAVDPIHIAPQKHAHLDRFSTPTPSEVVMVYALVNTLPTQGGLGLNHMNDVTPWPAYLQL